MIEKEVVNKDVDTVFLEDLVRTEMSLNCICERSLSTRSKTEKVGHFLFLETGIVDNRSEQYSNSRRREWTREVFVNRCYDEMIPAMVAIHLTFRIPFSLTTWQR